MSSKFTSTRHLKRVISLFLFLGFLLMDLPSGAQTPEAEKNFQQCRACHNLEGPKLIGPSLVEVIKTREQDWLIRFIRNSQEMVAAGDPIAVQVFEEFGKIPMPSHNLSDDQIKDILKYIAAGGKLDPQYAAQAASEQPVKAETAAVVQDSADEQMLALESKANRNNGTTFIITLIVMLALLTDLFFTKLLKWKYVHITLLLVGLFVLGEVTYKEAAAVGRQQYYQPDQPINFSHKVHAGQNQIDCQYCHSGASNSKSAGIPPVNVCMNCHNLVKKGTLTGTAEIAKIQEAWDNGKPIEWIRIHNLPDHVYFNHSQHVNAGKLDCAECHGDVKIMSQVMQVNDLSMKWCLDCHRKTEVQFANNKFYETYEKTHEKFVNGEVKKVTADMMGGSDCMKCHY
ncbi:c-type cytochrome [Bacteroidales bacterium]